MSLRACALFAAVWLWGSAYAVSGAAQVVWLDELDVSLAHSGWGNTQSKKSIGGNPLRLAGKTYERGIGTHPMGAFTIALAGGTKRFTGLVGLDDEVGRSGSAEFRIEADGKLRWTSGVMRGGDPPKPVDVDLTGVKLLRLVVTDGGDGYGNDHVDWVDARFEVSGARPAACQPPQPSAYEVAQAEFSNERGRFQAYQSQVFRTDALILPADRDGVDVAARRTVALLAHLQTLPGTRNLSAETAALQGLQAEVARIDVADPDARAALFSRVATLRRTIALANPLLNFDRMLFIKKHFLPPSEGQGNHMCDQYFGFHAIRAGGLFVLEHPWGDRPVTRDILADAVCENGRFQGQKLNAGGFLSPDLSYDGQTIVFAYTEAEPTRYRWTPESTYHLFQVHVDGSHLRQLTDGPWNDVHPCWLPNGRIAFISERRGGYGRCHGRPVPTYTLHSMNPDGSDIVCISHHETNEWHPSVNHDGLLVYTRWDYVDRGFNQAHHPWLTTPDGCDARAMQGNYAQNGGDRPLMEMNVRAIPASRKYVATAAAHHGQAYGSLVVVDPSVPDDDKMGPVKRLTPEVRFPEAEGGEVVYATAWPLSEEFTLCVYDPDGRAQRGTHNNFGIYLIDAFGNKEPLYRDPTISCLSPLPLRPRTAPPRLPHTTLVGRPAVVEDPERAPEIASAAVMNVYDGLLPWPEDTRITALRIIQVLPKSTPSADSPRIGYGGQKNARAVLGTVPVESDGSAHFRLPTGKPLFFQALDAQGRAVQSMRSDTYVQPGETLVCLGCHDPHARRHPPERLPLAMCRPPADIRPDVDGSHPFSFPRLVQPVLDRHCIRCHGQEPKAPDLRAGDWKRNPNRWYTSYLNLEKYAFFFGGVGWETPRTIPGKFGARASKLNALLERDHYGVKLPLEDWHRLTLWLDCNSDFFGAYEETEAQAAGQVVYPLIH